MRSSCLKKVSDPVMTVKRFANLTIGDRLVALPQTRVSPQHLDLLVDSGSHLVCGSRTVGRNVAVDFVETASCLKRPDYFCHDSIFLRTSPSDTVRPASASSRPRCTIRANASSRRISSYVLSSGCRPMMSIIASFTEDTDFSLIQFGRHGTDTFSIGHMCFCQLPTILHAAARRHNFVPCKGSVLAAISSPRRADGSPVPQPHPVAKHRPPDTSTKSRRVDSRIGR